VLANRLGGLKVGVSQSENSKQTVGHDFCFSSPKERRVEGTLRCRADIRSDMTHIQDAMRYGMESIYENIHKAEINQFITPQPEFSTAALLKQINNNLPRGGSINPCSEIRLGDGSLEAFRPRGERIQSGSITADSIVVGSFSDDKIKVNNMKQDYNEDFDEATWTIEVPGVPKEDIEVFQVQNVVYVKVKDRGRISKTLLTDEKITGSKLDLGVLTITIDRPHKKVAIEVS
jgi:HSP20 family molecular chaperone IbpA